MPRSANPYKRGTAVDFGEHYLGPGRAPRRYDTDSGPGLTAADIDVMVRAHFQDGYAAGERAAEPKLAAAQGRLGDAWDEGFSAGVTDRRSALAADLGMRIIGAKATLRAALGGPKSKLADRVAAALAELDEVTRFANAIAAGESIDEAVDPT